MNRTRTCLSAVCAALMLITPAFAQPPAARKPNFIQRHPTMTGIVAGVATRAALKRSAASKKRTHQRLNFAERHPTLTGIAAGVATRTAIKRTTPKHP